jgi:hypothetical protein
MFFCWNHECVCRLEEQEERSRYKPTSFATNVASHLNTVGMMRQKHNSATANYCSRSVSFPSLCLEVLDLSIYLHSLMYHRKCNQSSMIDSCIHFSNARQCLTNEVQEKWEGVVSPCARRLSYYQETLQTFFKK